MTGLGKEFFGVDLENTDNKSKNRQNNIKLKDSASHILDKRLGTYIKIN